VCHHEKFSPWKPELILPESQQKSPRPALPRIEDFPIRVPDTIRFADMDRQGHVNNAVYPTYFETGRVLQIYDPKDGLQVDGCTTVLARIEIDFLKELRWPGTVEIGTGIAEIGRSSYVFSQAIFNDGDYMTTLDVLAKQVGIIGIFSDWPGTVTYYANCMGLK